MRTVFLIFVAALLASCATTSPTAVTKVYDHKTNAVAYMAKPAESEFVGTSASATVAKRPSWYRSGHP